MITWPVEYVGMCLERCARSGVPPLAKPIRGFFAATVHFGRFLLSLPSARALRTDGIRGVLQTDLCTTRACFMGSLCPDLQSYITRVCFVLRAAFLLGHHLPLDPVWTEWFTVLDCRG